MRRTSPPSTTDSPRTGAATIDYVLVLGIILPLAAICLPMGMRIARSMYEMVCTLITWPFM